MLTTKFENLKHIKFIRSIYSSAAALVQVIDCDSSSSSLGWLNMADSSAITTVQVIEFLRILGSLAMTITGDCPAGEKYLRRALALANTLVKNNHAKGSDSNFLRFKATILTDLALNLESGIKFSGASALDEALKLHEQALQIWVSHGDVDIVKGLSSGLNNLGTILFKLNRLPEVLPYYERALACHLRFGPDHHDRETAIVWDNFGSLLRWLERPTEALQFHIKALKVFQLLLGENHPDTATCMINVANAYDLLEQTDLAVHFFKCGIANLQFKKKLYLQTILILLKLVDHLLCF